MRRGEGLYYSIDWLTVAIYFLMVIAGWLNIYASIYEPEASQSIFDLSGNSGKQLLFIGISLVIIVVIFVLDFRFFHSFAWIFYGAAIFFLLIVLFVARDINGAKSWIEIAGFRFQPSEFSKVATALALASLINSQNFRMSKWFNFVKAVLIFLVPMGMIILQKDLGTAIVFLGFFLVMYREGMTPIPLVLGIFGVIIFSLTILIETLWLLVGFGTLSVLLIVLIKKNFRNISIVVAAYLMVIGSIYGVDYILNDVLQPHQKDRIELVFNPNSDPLGRGWNLTQSKIAIGSGGLSGKGFLNGTQTKFDFVPEQSTDFIFCTIGEEHGFLGSFLLIALYVVLILRIFQIAERQKWRFGRVYGYSVASILFIHFLINIGMTIGLMPVIGIPLPFFSYGGSSLLAFTVLLFVLLKFDGHRHQLLERG